VARPGDPVIRAARRSGGGVGRVGYALSYELCYAIDDGPRLTALSVSDPRNRLLTLSGVQIVVSVDQSSLLQSRLRDDVTLYLLLHF